MTTHFVNKSVIDCINQEIKQLESDIQGLQIFAKANNKDIRFIDNYAKKSNQLARLRKALKPLINQYY